MDIAKLAELGIRNLHEVFGRDARGETLARGFCSDEALVHVRKAGITNVVDLRTADHNARLSARCAAVGLGYDHIPIDASSTSPDVLQAGLSRLFEIVDGGGFYISCQQGLHRTDIALALYYFYHDDGEIPEMVGHRTKGCLRCDDIMRRVNTMRPFFPGIPEAAFVERRRRFLSRNREFVQDAVLGAGDCVKSAINMSYRH